MHFDISSSRYTAYIFNIFYYFIKIYFKLRAATYISLYLSMKSETDLLWDFFT